MEAGHQMQGVVDHRGVSTTMTSGRTKDGWNSSAARCWRGVAWRGVAWRGVAWRGVAWRGVLCGACAAQVIELASHGRAAQRSDAPQGWPPCSAGVLS